MDTPIIPIAQMSGPGTDIISSFPEHARTKHQGPLYLRHGYTRLQVKNPGGMYYRGVNIPWIDNRSMWLQQWTWAKQQGKSWAKDEDLITFTRIMVDDYGIRNIIWYLGGRVCVQDPLREGRYHLAPFIETSKVPGVQIELAFDTDSWLGEHNYYTPQFKLAMALGRELRDKNIDISIEARPALGNHFWIGEIVGTLSLTSTENIRGYAARNNEAWMYGEIRRDIGTNTNKNGEQEILKTWTDTYGPNHTRITPIVRRPDLYIAKDVLPKEEDYS